VKRYFATCRQCLNRIVDYRSLIEGGVRKAGDGYLQFAAILPDRIDSRWNGTIVGNPVGPGLEERTGWEVDGESIIKIAVFVQVLRSGGGDDDKRRKDQGDQAHCETPLRKDDRGDFLIQHPLFDTASRRPQKGRLH